MDFSVTTKSTSSNSENHKWLGSSHGTDSARTATLDKAAFDLATAAPEGYFPSGTPLAKITASGLYGPYNSAATDGTEVLAGFLLVALDVPQGDVVVGALMDHGRVREEYLPVAIDAAAKADVPSIIFA